jgi:hypothetical protein
VTVTTGLTVYGFIDQGRSPTSMYIFRSINLHVLNEMVGYNSFIIFQYYYLNLKNFDLFLQFDWPTGNEISSLVGQR